MKLSQLINFKNLLADMSVDTIQQNADAELDKITYLANNQPADFETLSKNLEQRHQEIKASFENFRQDLDTLKLALKDLITEVEKPWFAESYRLYDKEMSNETVQDIKDRKPNLLPEIESFYHARISRYQGWQHPAMIIRPGFESYIDSMVSCDPLYLVDVKHELIEPAVIKYNEIYQNRLRLYLVSEQEDDSSILIRLPENQFGLVLVYNFFNFRPFELIRRYLEEIFVKLRPGGTLIMTINDCDRDKGVDLVERHFCCYTPGYLVEELARSIGYEIVFKWHNEGPSTWLELKRPGEFSTLRGGQTLAKVIPK